MLWLSSKQKTLDSTDHESETSKLRGGEEKRGMLTCIMLGGSQKVGCVRTRLDPQSALGRDEHLKYCYLGSRINTWAYLGEGTEEVEYWGGSCEDISCGR